jgi:ABC-type glycerol-3-phosphate transport system substrate-binding protein
MKIRQAFVANSSSSSFLILGNIVEFEDLKAEIDVTEFIAEYDEDDLLYEISDMYSKQTGLYCMPTNEDYEEFYVGAKIFSTSGGSMEISDLETKIASAKKLLSDKDITNARVYYGEIHS